MDIQLIDGSSKSIPGIATEALVVVAFEKENLFGPRVEAVAALRDYLAARSAAGDLPSKLYESATFHGVPGIAAKRVVVIGGGKREKFSLYELRRVAGAAVRLLKPKQLAEIVFAPDGVAEAHDAVQASVEGAIVADFDPGRYKTEGRNDDKHLGG